jgi:hypothetical protein
VPRSARRRVQKIGQQKTRLKFMAGGGRTSGDLKNSLNNTVYRVKLVLFL